MGPGWLRGPFTRTLPGPGGHGEPEKGGEPACGAVFSQRVLGKELQNILEIYTDGSVLDEGAAGAAFVVPEFNNMTHSFSLAGGHSDGTTAYECDSYPAVSYSHL